MLARVCTRSRGIWRGMAERMKVRRRLMVMSIFFSMVEMKKTDESVVGWAMVVV
jgi:hypothetical protein